MQNYLKFLLHDFMNRAVAFQDNGTVEQCSNTATCCQGLYMSLPCNELKATKQGHAVLRPKHIISAFPFPAKE